MKPDKAKDIKVFALGAGVKGASQEIQFLAGVNAEIAFLHLHRKDPKFSGKRKILCLFNEALTEARKLRLPIDGVPGVLRGILEEDPSPYLSGVVGEFWMQYSAFESKYRTSGPGTREKMRSFYSGEEVPLPYDVRNWLAHIGSQLLEEQKYSLSDVVSSTSLLRTWNLKVSKKVD